MKRVGSFILLSAFLSAAFVQAADLKWASGTVTQILSQNGNYNVAMIKGSSGSTLVQFCEAITTTSVQYDLLKTAFTHKMPVEVGYYDMGRDPQAGTEKLCIDRVSLE